MTLNIPEITAQNALSTNNSAISDGSDRLISLLEGGDGSIRMRGLVNNLLEEECRGNQTRIAELKKRKSLKDKINYIISLTTNDLSPRGLILQRTNELVEDIETKLLKSSDFSESYIIRHAALNRFECRLNPDDLNKLGKIVNKIRNFCTENHLEDLADNLDFHEETDAQSIMKVKEVIAILQKRGVDVSEIIKDDYKKLLENIKPLENLDKNYKNLMIALNQVHEVASHGYTDSVLSPTQMKKIQDIVKKESGEIINNFFDTDGNKDQIENGNKYNKNEQNYLEKRLNDFPVSAEELRQNRLSKAEFDKLFLTHFSGEILKEARLRFNKSKVDTFGHREKLFDQDVNKWRGIARQRVIELSGQGEDDSHNRLLDSYFEKFQSLFYLDRNSVGFIRQGVRNAVDTITGYHTPAQTNQMRDALSGILRRRYNNLQGHRDWNFGRGELDRVRDLLLNQNWTINEMFYNDRNPFEQNETGLQEITKIIGRTEQYREIIKTNLMPTVNTILRLSEEGIKLALKGIAGTGKITSKIISTPTSAFNKFIEKKAEGGFFKKNFIRLAKISGVLYPFTKLLEKGATGTHSLIEKTEGVVNKGYDSCINFIRK
ncbi:hypothetical protein KAZ01_03510, partial [Candidatus Gracilibacteria bacterium]|nr:hypothetical protein [Candidatus Gracilibacteria bacterium]